MTSTVQNSVPTNNYSHAVRQQTFPTREQAVVMEAFDGVNNEEYAKCLSTVTAPENIRFISRNNGRVIAYLKTKECADRLTENSTKIQIDSHTVEIRPLITAAKRVILSNVCPIIPHSVIIDKLEKINIRPTSQMLFIRAGYSTSTLTHVLGFRRQLYIHPDDVGNLPPFMKIEFEGINYWIYLSSTDKITCFNCKGEGHIAKYCQAEPVQAPPVNQVNNDDMEIEETLNSDLPESDNAKMKNTATTLPVTRIKRQFSASSATNSNNSNIDNFKDPSGSKALQLKKKAKKASSHETTREEIMVQVNPAKAIFEDKTKNYPFGYETTVDFLLSTFGVRDVYNKALTFTKDTSALVTLLTDIQQNISDAKLHRRLDRIKKRLLDPNIQEIASDSHSETDNEK